MSFPHPLRQLAIGLLMITVTILVARPASADATLFLGSDLTPSNRLVKGVSVGVSLLIVGFEFEYAATSEDDSAGAPSLKTGMGNMLLQPPTSIFGVLPYVTGGVGVFQEELVNQHNTDVGLNTGGGVKIDLVGPLRLRVDYRVFKLNGALYSPAHRIYAGLNLKF